jgi:glycosyltransferase involved in cell wall biosynthesis
VTIAFLNPSGELGGAETALIDIVAALKQARPSWTLAVIAAADGPLLDRVRDLAISIAEPFPQALARLGEWGARGTAGRLALGARVITSAPPLIGYTRRLQRRLLDLQPDIIHSNGLKMHLIGARTKGPKAKLLWHFHDYPGARPFTARLLAGHAHHCDVMLANSESVAAQARDVFGRDAAVHTLYNSVDLERFHPEGAVADLDALAGLAPLGPGGLRVGLVATFARWKGHRVFLDALARLRPSTGVRGYIIGGPIYDTDASQCSLAELRAYADALGLRETIGFTGRLDDVPAALRSLDVVVHASTEPEPFGMVIAEAMACGRAAVVSRAGGAAEIADGCVLFHEPGNSVELAERIGALIDDAALRESLGSAGRSTAGRLFSRDRLCGTLVPLYESLASSARS